MYEKSWRSQKFCGTKWQGMNADWSDFQYNIFLEIFFQYLLFVKVEKRNKNKQKIGLVEFFAGLIFANAYVGKILQD